MAKTSLEPRGSIAVRRTFQLPIVDGFLWLVRIAAIVLIVIGAFNSLTSARLSGQQWRDLVVFGIAQGSVYALIALGYTMVYGILRFINFAHGEVFMIGAMTGFYMSDGLSRTWLWEAQPFVSLLIVLICCMTVSALVAVLLERVAYRPLRGLPRLLPFITAIGASFFLQYTVATLFGTSVKAYPSVDALTGVVTFLGFRILKVQVLVIVAALLMLAGLYLYVEKTKAGRAIRAVAEDPEIAQLMGLSVDRTIVRVFAIGGALAGAAGFLFGLVFQNVHFLSGFLPGIKAFTAAVLGGIGNIPGAVLGGLIMGVSEVLVVGYVSSTYRDAIAFILLIVILLFRPAGLLGKHQAEKV